MKKLIFPLFSFIFVFCSANLFSQETVKDADNNEYSTIKIGSQVWMAENLKTTHYNDGNEIPQQTDKTKWATNKTAAFCWYDNDESNKAEYGALYNWYVVGTGKLCPQGWHVPTTDEWTTLENTLGGADQAAPKMKEKGTEHWEMTYDNVTNESGFNARGAGFRNSDGDFTYKLSDACWWTATPGTQTYAKNRCFSFYTSVVSTRDIQRTNGYSIRCVKN